MITFIENNRTITQPFIEQVFQNRYKDTCYSIVQQTHKTWTVFVIDDVGVFGVRDYMSYKDAVNAIESCNLKTEILKQYDYFNQILKVI